MRAGLRALQFSVLVGLVSCAFVLSVASPGYAQRKPLTDREQVLVNQAIEDGVRFLKRTQNATGDWPRKDAKTHTVGYTAFPALTLLECDVPADDPSVVSSAKLVRRMAPQLEGTYEIALAILFLDRLGNPNDKALIQTLATRLIAGQTVTGGWGYKCPKVAKPDQNIILTALRKLDPNPPMLGQVRRKDRDNPGMGGLVKGDKPGLDKGIGGLRPGLDKGIGGNQPGLDKGVVGKQPGLDKGVKTGGKGSLSGSTKDQPATASTSPGEQGTIKDVPPPPTKSDDKDRPVEQTKGQPGDDKERPVDQTKGQPGDGDRVENRPAENRPAEERERIPVRIAGRRWLGCIKEVEDTYPSVKPPEKPAKVADVVPKRLRELPIFQDGMHLLVDPEKRQRQAVAATTDNSNTQFAILALWAASRHDVPMVRTMRLVVRRFATSQSQEGGWGYRYKFGGGDDRPAMTCVGLLGLAIGQALIEQPAAADQLDPAILRGFAAASKHVGTANDGNELPPMANLYLLWSIERVAVLYNMPTIGGKDWYRWAAQTLVAHQEREGAWTNGGYHGAQPVIDTCLALLVLKQANLARDLGDRIAIDPKMLDRAVVKEVAPTPKDPPKEDNPPKTPPPGFPLFGVGSLTQPKPPGQDSPQQETPPTANAPTTSSQAETASPETARSGRFPMWLILLLVIAGLMLVMGVTWMVLNKNGDSSSEEERPRRKPKPTKAKK